MPLPLPRERQADEMNRVRAHICTICAVNGLSTDVHAGTRGSGSNRVACFLLWLIVTRTGPSCQGSPGASLLDGTGWTF